MLAQLLAITLMALAFGLLGYVKVQTTHAGGNLYQSAFVGAPPGAAVALNIDPSNFKAASCDYVDADGNLKPGSLIQADGTPVSGAGQTAAYIIGYTTRIAETNSDADLDAAVNQQIGVWTRGNLSKASIELNFARALSANENTAIGNNARFALIG